MTFTISNLKTGDLVICANGKMATVMKDTAREDVLRFHTEFNSFSRLGVNYNSDMTNNTIRKCLEERFVFLREKRRICKKMLDQVSSRPYVISG